MITDVSKEYEKIEQDKDGIIIKLMTGSLGYMSRTCLPILQTTHDLYQLKLMVLPKMAFFVKFKRKITVPQIWLFIC